MKFTVTLTGANDSLPDLILPCRAAQVNLNTTEAICSLQVPLTDTYVTDIEARPNGTLRVENDSGEVYCDVPFTNFRYDRDGTSQEGVLEGSGTYSNGTPGTVGEVKAFIESKGFAPSIRYRCIPPEDYRLRPGDTVTIRLRTFVVGFAVWYMSATYSWVEVRDGNSA